jgi:putative membrane protein
MDDDPTPASRVERPESLDERTRLANERTLLAADRTLLAWCRTAFGAYVLAVGLGGASLVSKSASSSYAVFGVIFAFLGSGAAALGVWQYLILQSGSDPGPQPWLRLRLSSGFAGLIALLGIGIAVLIITTR